MSGSEVYYALKQGKRLERPLRCPLFIYQLMYKCWDWDETRRPTFFQLVQLLKTDVEYRHGTVSSRKALLTDTMTSERSRADAHDRDLNAVVQL
jgi:hypothetical protein